MALKLNLLPPKFLKEHFDKKLKDEFISNFYSKKRFEDWKKENTSSAIKFDDFSKFGYKDGFVFKKSKELQKALFLEKGFVLRVKTNVSSEIKDYYNYLENINSIIKKEYISMARNELKNLRNSMFLKNQNIIINSNYLERIGDLNKFITSSKAGNKIFDISLPTLPSSSAPVFYKLILTLAFFGLLIGTVISFIFHSIKKLIKSDIRP